MRPDEMCRQIKPVDIGSLLRLVPDMEFYDTGGINAWLTVTGSAPPSEMVELVGQLKLGGKPIKWVCRKLMARQGIAAHVDSYVEEAGEIRRFHIPITSHPDIVMRWPNDNFEMHLEPGWLYEVCYSRLHEVINNTDSERVHLQINQLDATI